MDKKDTQRIGGFRLEAPSHESDQADRVLVLLGKDEGAEVEIARYDVPEDLWQAITSGEREFATA